MDSTNGDFASGLGLFSVLWPHGKTNRTEHFAVVRTADWLIAYGTDTPVTDQATYFATYDEALARMVELDAYARLTELVDA